MEYDFYTQKKLIEANTRMANLYGMQKSVLIEIVTQNYRVIDTRGMTKDQAISYILEAEFGKRIMDIMNRK